MSPSGMEIGRYSVASVYFAGFSSAFFAQSSQQTVISLPPALTLIPPSLMSQSHTGHLVVFIACPFCFEFEWRRGLQQTTRPFSTKGSYQGGRDQTSRFLLISRNPPRPASRRTSEGVRTNARRKESVKWLWLEKPSSRASAVRSFAPSASRSSEARNRRHIR